MTRYWRKSVNPISALSSDSRSPFPISLLSPWAIVFVASNPNPPAIRVAKEKEGGDEVCGATSTVGDPLDQVDFLPAAR
jgi:hypothetical protein